MSTVNSKLLNGFGRLGYTNEEVEKLGIRSLSDFSLITTPDENYTMLTLSDKLCNEILRFESNGDIYIHGKLIENDMQVVYGFREFLNAYI